MPSYKYRIASRYLLILANIGEMAESGEFVSDLPCSAVRACLSAMKRAGAAPIEIFDAFGKAIRERYEAVPPERTKYRAVLERAYADLAFLLMRDEYLVSSLGSSKVANQEI